MSGVFEDISQTIGGTPLIRINKLSPKSSVVIWAKVEYFNPAGSVKDRIALRMLMDAKSKGYLDGGKTLLEATSGNTGVALAMVGAVHDIPVEIVMCESATDERKQMIRAYGATLTLTPTDEGCKGAVLRARELLKDFPEKYHYVNQFANEMNTFAHYRTTAEEICRQSNRKVDHVVVTIGSTGTINGISRGLREIDPSIKIVCVKPVVGDYIPGMQNMEEGFVPEIFDPRAYDMEFEIDSRRAIEMMRRVAAEEGIFCGVSSGAAMQAAVDLAKELDHGNVVVVLPDGGEK